MNDQISFSSNRNSVQKFKIVLVGDQNVGKSSIITRYTRNQFDPTKNPTIGIDFISKNIAIQGTTIRLQLWDTAGQQRFKSLIPSYLKDAHLALIIFDLTSHTSAENINKWLDFTREAGKPDIKIYAIGNKSDLEAEISPATKKLAEEIANSQANAYYEVSAKTGSNIDQLFSKIADDLLSTPAKKDKPSNPKDKPLGTENLNNNIVLVEKKKPGPQQVKCCAK